MGSLPHQGENLCSVGSLQPTLMSQAPRCLPVMRWADTERSLEFAGCLTHSVWGRFQTNETLCLKQKLEGA